MVSVFLNFLLFLKGSLKQLYITDEAEKPLSKTGWNKGNNELTLSEGRAIRALFKSY